jgi:hypothetical protein
MDGELEYSVECVWTVWCGWHHPTQDRKCLEMFRNASHYPLAQVQVEEMLTAKGWTERDGKWLCSVHADEPTRQGHFAAIGCGDGEERLM